MHRAQERRRHSAPGRRRKSSGLVVSPSSRMYDMKNVALCGAAVPSTLTIVPGADANCWIWFRKDPAMNDAKNTVMTCARAKVLSVFPVAGSP